MNDPKSKASSLLWQSAQGKPGKRLVGAFTQLPFLIRKLGADPAPVFAEAGMAPGDLAQPSLKVPYENLMILLDVAARQTKCHHFGFLAGSIWRLSDLGPLGEMMRHSRNVGMALENLVVFQQVNSEGAAAFLKREGNTVNLGYTFYVPFKANTAQFYDAVMAAAVNFMRELCGDDWEPSAVLFPHLRPRNLAPYRRHFRSRLVFESPTCAIQFGSEDLIRPIASAREKLRQKALKELKREGMRSVADLVSRSVRNLLLRGQISKEDVAKWLGMQQRTISRRLEAEGVTFRQILDSVRFAAAKDLLEGSSIPVEQIAASLGYADSESFYRAFKKWCGMTPGVWRKTAH
jgi:AraC-like DNA-binding protein